jgi:hypothetical protein
MTDERWRKEGSWHGLLEVVSRHLPGGLRNTTKNLNHDSWYPGPHSNRAPFEYELSVLPLLQLARRVRAVVLRRKQNIQNNGRTYETEA